MNPHLQPWHIMSYEALSSGTSDSFGMIPCFFGKTPTVAIAMFRETGRTVEVMPLYVALTPDMPISYPDKESEDGGSGGGPDRDTVNREFYANKAMMAPAPGGSS